MDRYTIRSLLKPLTPEELGELITDCGLDFINETKINLSIHIENILKILRRNENFMDNKNI
jgi:hypothetical protein